MSYSNGLLSSSTASLQRGLPGLPGIGFKLTDDGDFDIDRKRLTNLADSTDDSDAVNLKVLKEHTNSQTNYHLQPSFTFYKYDKEGKPIESSNVVITNHNHFGQLGIERQGVKDGFAYSDIKMTNNLSPGTYSILFEIFGYDGSKIVTDGQEDRLLFYNVEGDSRIINFDHVWFSNYIEGYLVFSNSKNVVNITLQFRYYGSSDSNFKFLFYSRCIKGVQKSGFDHRIFNLKSADFAGHILYFEPINMNNEKIMNIGNPTDDKDVVNKKYVDDQIANVNIDTTPLLPRDGSRNMTGNLDMNNNRIISCGRLTMNNDTVSPIEMYGSKILNCGGLTMKNDLNSPISMNNNRIYNLPNPTGDQQPVPLVFGDNRYLKRDGSKAMTGNLNMDDHVITGIRSSSTDNAALTVGGAKATYLPLLGDRSMQGNLNMGGFTIRNIRPFVEDDSSQAASDAQKNDVINYGYFHTQRGELKQLINEVGYDALNRKNPDPMEDNIDMANHQIKGLNDGQ